LPFRNPGGSAKAICPSISEAAVQTILEDKLRIYSGNDDLDNPKIDLVHNLDGFSDVPEVAGLNGGATRVSFAVSFMPIDCFGADIFEGKFADRNGLIDNATGI
jgi:hypothetical protein